MSYSADMVVVDVYCGPFRSDEDFAAWQRKLERNKRERRRQLTAALGCVVSRIPLQIGLVVRLMGGPPMTEAEARRHGYHAWMADDRASTKVSIDRSQVPSATARAEEYHWEVATSWLPAWRLFWSRTKLDAYRAIEAHNAEAEADTPPQESGISKANLARVLAEAGRLGAEALSSLASISWGTDAQAAVKLQAAGSRPVRETIMFTHYQATPDDLEAVPDEQG